jgi:hypothetical protein
LGERFVAAQNLAGSGSSNAALLKAIAIDRRLLRDRRRLRSDDGGRKRGRGDNEFHHTIPPFDDYGESLYRERTFTAFRSPRQVK